MAKKKGTLKKIVLSILGIIVLFILITIINLIIFERNASIVSTGRPIKKMNEIHPALLVIDVQEATTGELSLNSYYIKKSTELIDNINTVAEQFKFRKFPIIYIRSEITNPLINLLNSSFAKGSKGAQFDNRLKLLSHNELIKSRNDAFINTNLDSFLVENNINHLYITGLDAAYCLNVTIAAALNRKYHISIINDAVLSESEAMKDSMLIEFSKRNVQHITTYQVKDDLDREH